MKQWTTKGGQVVRRLSHGMYNCFLVSLNGRHLLVDACRKGSWQKLSRELDELGVNGGSLAGLVLTHTHYDHAENAAAIKDRYNPKIIVHKKEADYVRRGENPVIHGTLPLTGWISDRLSHWYLSQFFRYRPVDGDLTVAERYDLKPLGFQGYLLSTPGHSPGSLSVILENEIAIVGDALFGVFKGSAIPPVAADEKRMVASWEKLLKTGCSLYLPAHGSERGREILERQHEKYKRKYDRP
ncbi:MAG: MBL fold metallo-hydrolase, partial [Smithellaceae bacterium]|jgi:glyoxylase-like metal-dependent hydrolase (beta-lactamase superfamily II)